MGEGAEKLGMVRGFVASIGVSYALQHAWVFRSAATHAVAAD